MMYVTITNPVRNYTLNINVTNGNGDGKTTTIYQRIYEQPRPPIINARFAELIVSSSGNTYAKSVTYDLSIYFTNFNESGTMTYSIANSGVYAYITNSRFMTVYYNGLYLNRSYNVIIRASNNGGSVDQALNVREVS